MSRRTAQRSAIRDVVEDASRPLTAAEIHESATARVPGIGLATVYRNVSRLVDEGVLVEVPLPDEPMRYEAEGLDHHHHFRCRACGRVFDVPGCAGAIAGLAPTGFVVEQHEILLVGQCADCAAA